MRNCKYKLLGAAALLAGMASCLDVDPTVGDGYIPGDHIMRMQQDSTFVVKSYNVTTDSVISSMQGLNLLGSFRNLLTGVGVDAGVVFQLAANLNFEQGDSLYGTAPVIDSARLRFAVRDAQGPTGVPQTFDLYEMSLRPRIDSVYYYSFDPTPYLSARPLASVTHSGTGDIDLVIDDPDFLRRLADTTGYEVDTLFKKRFPAFYIVPRATRADAALYRIDLTDESSMLITWYHNAEYPDTLLRARYSPSPYQPEVSDLTPPNQTINVVSRDYTNALPELRLNDPDAPVAHSLVESFEGIVTRLEFMQESIEALKAKAVDAGFREIGINKAVLQVYYPSVPDQREALPERLGMYFDFKNREGIPDYSWYSEYESQLSGNPQRLTYDGWIRPARTLYQMDISDYMQRLVKGVESRTTVYLAPSYETLLFPGHDNWSNPHTARFFGFGSEMPPRLIITYTMIR